MAVLGSILFNRSLKQFLDCKDLDSDKGIALTGKIRQSAKESLQRLIEVIPETSSPHSEVLMAICLEHVEGSSEELFLKSLDSDETNIRTTAATMLSQSTQINPSKLFQKLHLSDVSKPEIIDILGFQIQNRRPELIISNALKLETSYAERLIKMAEKSELPLDLDALLVDPAAIKNPSLRIMLLRYLGKVEQARVAQVIGQFLGDSNKTVVIEALKALKGLKVDFDASILLPHIESMSTVEHELAMEILRAQANAELVPKLAAWTTSKSDENRETFIKLVVRYVTQDGLEKFLLGLEKQEWWGKEQAIKCLRKFGDDRLYSAAQGLCENTNEFVRDNAQQLAAQSSDPADLKALWDNALHENWQVRENAIEAIGKSAQRDSMGLLKKVIEKWPESSVAVLQAIAQLGFSKGLEIAFLCLKMPEALVQREALETIGKLATKKYAADVRDKLMSSVPKLQATVRDTAGQVVRQLTETYELSELDVDAEQYFDTRLLKIEDTMLGNQTADQVQPVAAPGKTAAILNIEDMKKGDLWLDRYRIDKEIGRGAMGRVMLAEDEMVGEPLILKFMHPELTAEEASRERFLREVKYSRKVSHHNVIRIHDMLFQDNLCAISMEYFHSRGIDEYLREKKFFEPIEALEILVQVSDGMAAAHRQDVIHRDLKPSNILMDDSGLVKVVDFGIASASTNTDATLTKVGSIIGTPAYISPERAKGLEADLRSDIYALGIIAYCMLTGELPYRGEPMALLFQHLEGNARPAHEVRNSVDARSSLLVQKLMVVDPDDRIQTMEEVSVAIRDTLEKLKS